MSFAKTITTVPVVSFFLLAMFYSNCAAEPQIEGFGVSGYSGGGSGNNWAIGGMVGRFGEKPVKIKKLDNESNDTPSKETNKQHSDYDFTTDLERVVQPSYLPVARVSNHDFVAKNKGRFPVTLVVDANQELIHSSCPLPFIGVVPPNSTKTLLQLKRTAKSGNERIGYTLYWDLGSVEAKHDENYNYQLPFGNRIKAFASVNEGDRKVTPYTKHAVVFSMPAGTPVLFARNGVIIRIRKSALEVLHDDSTIGVYSHIDKTDHQLYEGKAVRCGDELGTAGAAEGGKESFLQFTVWKLELANGGVSRSTAIKFDHVSVPLKFCIAGSKACNVLTKSGLVARGN